MTTKKIKTRSPMGKAVHYPGDRKEYYDLYQDLKQKHPQPDGKFRPSEQQWDQVRNWFHEDAKRLDLIPVEAGLLLMRALGFPVNYNRLGDLIRELRRVRGDYPYVYPEPKRPAPLSTAERQRKQVQILTRAVSALAQTHGLDLKKELKALFKE